MKHHNNDEKYEYKEGVEYCAMSDDQVYAKLHDI